MFSTQTFRHIDLKTFSKVVINLFKSYLYKKCQKLKSNKSLNNNDLKKNKSKIFE